MRWTAFFFSIVLMSISSCSNEDKIETHSSTPERMVGYWEFDTYSIFQDGYSYDEQPVNSTSCEYKRFFNLKTAGFCTAGAPDLDCVLYTHQGTWKIDDYGMLVFEDGTTFSIVSVSASKLILRNYLYSVQFTLIKKQ